MNNESSLVVDSCCDLDPELQARVRASLAPLTITIDDQDYIDDGTVQLVPYLSAMKASVKPPKSACPSPALYMEHMLSAKGDCFVITLSSRLSGSYNAAMAGRGMALEEQPDKRIHVFDSESACAGETLLATLVRDMIDAGKSFEEIIAATEEKIAGMRTLFVLDSFDNLVKNGRMMKVAVAVANILSLRPVMSDDGKGGIKLAGKGRGNRGALAQMVEICRKQTENLAERSQRLVISYCNCLERARSVRDMIWQKCPAIGEIIMTPTSALSAMYAEDGGIVIAY